MSLSFASFVAACVCLWLSAPPWAPAAEPPDPCSAASSVSDVRLTLDTKDHRIRFQQGEIVPLVLLFSSSTSHRYWADVRSYDRSGRLRIEAYCVDPPAPDPLALYFKTGGGGPGGGLGSTRELDATPLIAEAELNEWRTLAAGHYRVYAVSQRVWRPPTAGEDTPYGRIAETVRSNVIEIDVDRPDPAWQSAQLQTAVREYLAASSPDEARRAARILRFLSTEDSTRELGRLFRGLDQQHPAAFDLMMGLYGSPYRQTAIDSMHAAMRAPDHAVTSEFLDTLVNKQVNQEPAWDPPDFDRAHAEQAQAWWLRRQKRADEVMTSEVQTVIADLPKKSREARALTLAGLLRAGSGVTGTGPSVRAALVAAWADLPAETRDELIVQHWQQIAGPEMLPILRHMLELPPPPYRTQEATLRDATLRHLWELNPAAGREAILCDLMDPKAQPDLKLVRLLPAEDLRAPVQAAVERIVNNGSRELDFELVDRYADANALPAIQTVFEPQVGRFGCAPQSALLRYYLRVAPEYGAKQVAAALSARKGNGCYKYQLHELGVYLPKVQQTAVDALDDPEPEVVRDAVTALGRWGSAEAEPALWKRLERLHKEWHGREGELRYTPNFQDPGSRAAALEQALVAAIARAPNWLCPPEELAHLKQLVWTRDDIRQIDGWKTQWGKEPVEVSASWDPENDPRFQILQYDPLSEDQLHAKLAQFPAGTRLQWQFLRPVANFAPAASIETQDAYYERARSVAQSHGIVLESN